MTANMLFDSFIVVPGRWLECILLWDVICIVQEPSSREARIQAQQGMALVMSAGWENIHRVDGLLGGTRYVSHLTDCLTTTL